MLPCSLKRFTFCLFVLILNSLCGFIFEADADVLYFKDGRVVEGLIRSENENVIKLDFEFGSIEFNKDQIERTYKSTPDETYVIRQKWESRKSEIEKSGQEERPGKGQRLKKGEDPQKVEHILVNAILNKKVPARLLLDTGASYIILSKAIGKKLGIDINNKETIQLQLGDGRRTSAKYLSLDSVDIQGAEATDVGTAVLMDDSLDIISLDGVLGMSFLNRFNFKVDHSKKQLIFEKLK